MQSIINTFWIQNNRIVKRISSKTISGGFPIGCKGNKTKNSEEKFQRIAINL